MLFSPSFFLTFLALSFAETFGKCKAQLAHPLSLKQMAHLKLLSKMHASPCSPHTLLLESLTLYFCFPHTASLFSLPSPLPPKIIMHTGTHSGKANQGQAMSPLEASYNWILSFMLGRFCPCVNASMLYTCTSSEEVKCPVQLQLQLY